MTTFRHLSPSLRAAVAAPWLLIAAAVALGSTPAFRQVLLDAANAPTTDVSLSSSHWTGTLDANRLPTSVPLEDESGNLSVPGGFSAGGNQIADPGGNLYPAGSVYSSGDLCAASSLYVNGNQMIDPNGNLLVPGTTVLDNYQIYTSGGGTMYMDGLFVGPYPVADKQGNLYASSTLYVSGGMCVWGSSPPSSQPAAPTNLAGIIALLQSYGFCQ